MQEQHVQVMCDKKVLCRRSGHYCRGEKHPISCGAAGCSKRSPASNTLWSRNSGTSCQKERQLMEYNPARMAAKSADGGVFDSGRNGAGPLGKCSCTSCSASSEVMIERLCTHVRLSYRCPWYGPAIMPVALSEAQARLSD